MLKYSLEPVQCDSKYCSSTATVKIRVFSSAFNDERVTVHCAEHAKECSVLLDELIEKIAAKRK